MSLLQSVRPHRALESLGYFTLRCAAIHSRVAIHTSITQAATPLTHPAAPGPPPKPPLPAVTLSEERLARKQRQAELLKRAEGLRAGPAKPGTAMYKRFWKNVDVKETDAGYQIMLDSRPVRTATKSVLTIPLHKPQLAIAMALEWDFLVTAQQALRQNYIPLTSLVSRALDIQAGDDTHGVGVSPRAQIVDMVMGYLSTDTLLCWAPSVDPHNYNLDRAPTGVHTLRSLQERTAQPIIDFLCTHVWPGAALRPELDETSIMPRPQSDETTSVVREWVRGLPAWELAGLERGVLASKSLLIATRLLVDWSPMWRRGWDAESAGERFGVEHAARACNLEVAWQTGVWGEVEDTHDVDKEDLRRQLGSVILLVNGDAR